MQRYKINPPFPNYFVLFCLFGRKTFCSFKFVSYFCIQETNNKSFLDYVPGDRFLTYRFSFLFYIFPCFVWRFRRNNVYLPKKNAIAFCTKWNNQEKTSRSCNLLWFSLLQNEQIDLKCLVVSYICRNFAIGLETRINHQIYHWEYGKEKCEFSVLVCFSVCIGLYFFDVRAECIS